MGLSRQTVAIAMALLIGVVAMYSLRVRSQGRIIDAGFWFEPLSFESSALGGAVTAGDLSQIEQVARRELEHAFSGLRIRISNRRDTSYRVRVVEGLQDLRMRRAWEVAGASRAVSGFGGSGDVSFRLLASYALTYVSPDADRAAMVVAIGRGVGRAAVHEFAHQFLPTTAIHVTGDTRSYEFWSAARPEQYLGDMRWGPAWPLLTRRFGSP